MNFNTVILVGRWQNDWNWIATDGFCRATLCTARPTPSCGVRPSVCLSATFVYCIERSSNFP